MSFASGLKTIVVATDLSGNSEAALEYARKLAGGYGARIVLAHGLDPVDYAAVDAVPGRVAREMTEQARAALDEMSRDLLREGIHSHSEIRQGAVAEMLVDVARQYQAGLIVIGTKGMRRRRAGDCGRDCRATGSAGAVPGAGGGRGLECRRVSPHSGRAGAAGDGA